MHLKRYAVAAAVVLLAASFGAPRAAVTYKIDPVHSSVAFSVRHMMVTNVKGTFENVEGTIVYDADDMAKSSVEVTIDVASIDTRNQKRDDHLRSEDFFYVQQHPKITFKSTKVAKKGDKWVATGDLTIRGVSKQVDLVFVVNGPAKNPWGQTVIGVDIEPLVVDRTQFGLEWNTALEAGGVLVGDDVTIQLGVEAAKQ